MPVGHDETELCEHATRTTGSAYINQHTCTLQDLRARSDARSRSRLTVVDTSSRELVLTYVGSLRHREWRVLSVAFCPGPLLWLRREEQGLHTLRLKGGRINVNNVNVTRTWRK